MKTYQRRFNDQTPAGLFFAPGRNYGRRATLRPIPCELAPLRRGFFYARFLAGSIAGNSIGLPLRSPTRILDRLPRRGAGASDPHGYAESLYLRWEAAQHVISKPKGRLARARHIPEWAWTALPTASGFRFSQSGAASEPRQAARSIWPAPAGFFLCVVCRRLALRLNDRKLDRVAHRGR
jgi:hypothetical protein